MRRLRKRRSRFALAEVSLFDRLIVGGWCWDWKAKSTKHFKTHLEQPQPAWRQRDLNVCLP